MKTHFKTTITVAIAILLAVIGSAFFLTQQSRELANEQMQSHSTQLRRSVTALTVLQSEQIAIELTRNIELELKDQAPNILTPEAQIAFGLLRQDSSGQKGWKTDWIKSADPSLNKNWLNEQLISLALDAIDGEKIHWARIVAPSKQVYFMQIFAVDIKNDQNNQAKLSFAILPTSVFSSIHLISKGDNASFVYVVDEDGVTFSYPDQQYVGSKITTHPIVSEIVNNKKSSFSGVFHDSNNHILIGGYEKLHNSNLFVVTFGRAESQAGLLGRYFSRLLLLCLGIVAAAVCLMLIWDKEAKIEMQRLKNYLLQQQIVNQKVNTIKEYDGKTSVNLAHGIIATFGSPITYVLGLIQAIEIDIRSAPAKSQLIKAVRELRKVRELVDSLQVRENVRPLELEVVGLTTVVSQALDICRPVLRQDNIEIEELWNADVSVKADYDNLKNAVKYILCYSIEKLKNGVEEKKIKLTTVCLGNSGSLQISIIGAGLTDEERRILFSQVSSLGQSEVLGLELNIAFAYIQQLNGDLTVESVSKNEFMFSLQLPILPNRTELSDSLDLKGGI